MPRGATRLHLSLLNLSLVATVLRSRSLAFAVLVCLCRNTGWSHNSWEVGDEDSHEGGRHDGSPGPCNGAAQWDRGGIGEGARDPAADRNQRKLRVHRQSREPGVHAALPGRLLHRLRPEQRHRPPHQLQDRRHACQRLRLPHRSGPLQRFRWLQPGLGDPRQDPRHRNRRRRARHGRCADQRHRPVQKRRTRRSS